MKYKISFKTILSHNFFISKLPWITPKPVIVFYFFGIQKTGTVHWNLSCGFINLWQRIMKNTPTAGRLVMSVSDQFDKSDLRLIKLVVQRFASRMQNVLISLWFLEFLIYNSFSKIEENTFATSSYVIFYFGPEFNSYSEVRSELNQTNIRIGIT